MGGVEMRRSFVFALVMASLAGTANAADVDPFSLKSVPFKDPLPDCLSWYGVTFFATLDVGYA